MADVRREGSHYIALRRIYEEQKEGRKGRTLLYAVGQRMRADEVENLGLSVEDVKKPAAPKTRAKKK